jgi:predicted RNase H-like nuclease (RuvC/YqgF family)
MSILKNLKSLFIEETEAAGQSDVVSSPKDDQATAVVPTPEAPLDNEQNSSAKQVVDHRFLDTLLAAMEAKNQEGFDYLEFRQALKSLDKMAFDEATKFKTAFAMAQSMKATPDHLTNTAKQYLGVLQQEENKFTVALKAQEENQVHAREVRLADLDKSVTQKQQEIEKLMAEITTFRDESTKLQSELSSVHQKISVTRDRFTFTYSFLLQEIKADIEKMQQYLK